MALYRRYSKKGSKNFGYTEIRTPIFEHTELFERGVGDTTDVVEKKCIHLLTAEIGVLH